MDNLTHSLAAVLLARTGLNRLVPGATPLLVVAANLPDLDIAHGLRGSLCYLEYHRGFTHAPFWFPLLALLPLPLWFLWARRRHAATPRQLLPAYAVSLAGLCSHPLLDLLNTYGIRLGLPFSSTWHRLDWLNVVDVLAWILLGLFVAGPLLSRLVDSEIASVRKKALPSRAAAAAGLALFLAFIGLRASLHARAVNAIEARLYSSHAPLRHAALPTAVNPWQWNAIVETPSAWHFIPLNLLADFDPDQGQRFLKPDIAPIEPIVRSTETGRVFLDFAQFPLWRLTPVSSPENGLLVSVHDLRFGPPGEGGFRIEILLDASRRVVRQSFSFGPPNTARPSAPNR